MADPVEPDDLPEISYPVLSTDLFMVARGNLLYRVPQARIFSDAGRKKPVVADFSSTRAGGGSLNDTARGIRIDSVITVANTNSWQYVLMPITRGGTNSYRAVCRFRRQWPMCRFAMTGMMLRDSVSSDSTIISLGVDSVAGFNRNRYTDDTTFSAVAAVAALDNAGDVAGLVPDMWMKIEDDNTNRYTYCSLDGENWFLLQSEGNTVFVTPTHVGFAVNPNGFLTPSPWQGGTVYTTLEHFEFTAF